MSNSNIIHVVLFVIDGARYLFVVNHPHENSQVEIFQFLEEELTLVHIKTIKHELLHKYVKSNITLLIKYTTQ